MNIYKKLIIHSAIKWGTIWHERRSASLIDWQLLTRLEKIQKNMLCQIHNAAVSLVRGSDASASTWHPHHANDNLFGFKGAGPYNSLCALKYSQTLPSPWPKCWLHTNTPPGRTKRPNIKSKHRKKWVSLSVSNTGTFSKGTAIKRQNYVCVFRSTTKNDGDILNVILNVARNHTLSTCLTSKIDP